MKEKHPVERFHAMLRKAGLKATAQRDAVHEAMCALGHASADMVAEWIGENTDVEISTASVYNTLAIMADRHIYDYRLSANNKMYFDVNTFEHFHMYDRENNEFKDVVDEDLYNEIMEIIGRKRFRGYSVDGIDIQFIVHPTKRKKKA